MTSVQTEINSLNKNSLLQATINLGRLKDQQAHLGILSLVLSFIIKLYNKTFLLYGYSEHIL